jgi:hypothetical protein
MNNCVKYTEYAYCRRLDEENYVQHNKTYFTQSLNKLMYKEMSIKYQNEDKNCVSLVRWKYHIPPCTYVDIRSLKAIQ